MPYDEMVNDRASWACHTLASVLALPSVASPGDEVDREIHEAFTMLASCPAKVRRYWLADYGVPEGAYTAWRVINDIARGVQA